MSDVHAVGLIGLGNMGAAVASRLVRAGRLIGFDLDAERRAAAEADGVEAVDTLEAFAQCRIVFLSLPTPAISLAVARDLSAILAPGSIVVETSTVNPDDMRRMAALLGAKDIRSTDVAILSGVGGMSAGTSILLAGGKDDDLAELAPVLGVMSSSVMRFGPVGTGMAAKVVNNAVAHAVMVVLAEAAAISERSGIDLTQMLDLLQDPEAGLMRPLTHRMRERVMNRDFAGGMPTEAARKDSVLALALAQTLGVPLFAIQGAHSAYELAMAAGLARNDYASIATLWDEWSGTSERKDDHGRR
ncbi:NAD(P)-dependent oxidoreductase [Agromyces sp. NPDC049794]|uniref:NAD(P)-dependent oxidoreductase n=1 Tax=unclassified Agromyces TaxID=2639701 RepID=UPI0033F073DD